MHSAKDIRVAPIASADARRIVKQYHYSGKVVNNSCLHFGVFLGGRCLGAMSFGPSLDKRKIVGLVAGTGWNGFLELNRLAFSDELPRNSESRALAVAMRLIRQHAPHVGWVVSFADGTQCGDGTIYRAAGFVLTGVVPTRELLRLPGGEVVHRVDLNTSKGKRYGGSGKYGRARWVTLTGGVPVDGHMMRYVYFIDPRARERITVPVLPFSRIAEMGAGMYRGKPTARAGSIVADAPAVHAGEGRSILTPALYPTTGPQAARP